MTSDSGIKPQLCTGCRSCMLACSFSNCGAFNPAKSCIVIEENEETATFGIKFTDECIQCQTCVDYCDSGALISVA